MKEYLLWLAKFITTLIVLFVFIPFLIGGIFAASSAMFSGGPALESKKGVAVVEIAGMILDSKDVLEKLHKHAANKDILGIVLDINSPGGAVGPSQAIYSTVKKLRETKPIVATLGSVAASGGLYSALGAQKIYSQPGTLTGSIGVIIQLPNFSKIADEYGFQMITIKSGELKDVGNSFRPMTEKDKDFLQTSVNRIREDFVNAVAESRGLEKNAVDEVADGRIILGSEAVELGLIDGFGTVYDAAREVYALAEVDLPTDETPRLVYDEDQIAKLRKALGAGALENLVIPEFVKSIVSRLFFFYAS